MSTVTVADLVVELPYNHHLGLKAVEGPDGSVLLPGADYLKNHVDSQHAGALFSAGDAHAAQGDGEVCINGIECPLDVTLRFLLHKQQPLAGPIVEASDVAAPDSSADAWVVVETGTDLADTARAATSRMIDLLVGRWGFTEIHAYILCSVALKLRLSQVVNEPVHTVSAALSKQILPPRELFPTQ